MNYEITKLKKMSDKRGYLIEFLKNSEIENKEFGQNYFVTFDSKEQIRGNHYHKKKSEWFAIAFGKAEVNLRDLQTGETVSLILSDDEDGYLTRLFVGTNIAHSFKSLSEKAVLLNYTDREYHLEDPDTYFYDLGLKK
ncbi:MAG: hypothetical protein HGA31_02985 [Candidatus Moranbacteria bacterium]|nr:hypothetical protein [Candidatus Moranbacteria bacterium]